jgi:hypothetical protein
MTKSLVPRGAGEDRGSLVLTALDLAQDLSTWADAGGYITYRVDYGRPSQTRYFN